MSHSTRITPLHALRAWEERGRSVGRRSGPSWKERVLRGFEGAETDEKAYSTGSGGTHTLSSCVHMNVRLLSRQMDGNSFVMTFATKSLIANNRRVGLFEKNSCSYIENNILNDIPPSPYVGHDQHQHPPSTHCLPSAAFQIHSSPLAHASSSSLLYSSSGTFPVVSGKSTSEGSYRAIYPLSPPSRPLPTQSTAGPQPPAASPRQGSSAAPAALVSRTTILAPLRPGKGCTRPPCLRTASA